MIKWPSSSSPPSNAANSWRLKTLEQTKSAHYEINFQTVHTPLFDVEHWRLSTQGVPFNSSISFSHFAAIIFTDHIRSPVTSGRNHFFFQSSSNLLKLIINFSYFIETIPEMSRTESSHRHFEYQQQLCIVADMSAVVSCSRISHTICTSSAESFRQSATAFAERLMFLTGSCSSG